MSSVLSLQELGWTEGISKKTGKPFWAHKDGRTQWIIPNIENEQKKKKLLQKLLMHSSSSELSLCIKHLVLCLCTLDYKDLEHYIYSVLDIGACHENNLENVWKKEGCTVYRNMDIKKSFFQGDFLGCIPWNQVEKIKETYDIITLLETLNYIYFEEDLKHLLDNINKHLSSNGRFIIITNEKYQFENFMIKYLQKLGFYLSLFTVLSQLLVYAGIDCEKLNSSREFEWNMFYLKILNQYSSEEIGISAEDWEVSSKFVVYIFEKKRSTEIKNLQKNLNLYF